MTKGVETKDYYVDNDNKIYVTTLATGQVSLSAQGKNHPFACSFVNITEFNAVISKLKSIPIPQIKNKEEKE